MSSYNEGPHKPFNDAMEHQQNIVGTPLGKKGRLPLPIKLIGYFMVGGSVLFVLIGIILNFLN
ncbi:hypothetical protein ACFSTA_07675 [Ornithinibacillus salinisoli]|uniref:Amino acid transporter n=1 Tax=Ornithinibacillus salinisoli TaxID=1848459 RepID=A0ABW4W110_9BACI